MEEVEEGGAKMMRKIVIGSFSRSSKRPIRFIKICSVKILFSLEISNDYKSPKIEPVSKFQFVKEATSSRIVNFLDLGWLLKTFISCFWLWQLFYP